MTFCHVSYPWMALVDPVGQRSVLQPEKPLQWLVRPQIALSGFLFHSFDYSPNIRDVFCLILSDLFFLSLYALMPWRLTTWKMS